MTSSPDNREWAVLTFWLKLLPIMRIYHPPLRSRELVIVNQKVPSHAPCPSPLIGVLF